jgi:large exoprotein involved in heme utilization and adhesion
LIVTGKGGLPEDPTLNLRANNVWSDLRLGDLAKSVQANGDRQDLRDPDFPITEAQTWKINQNGKIELVAIAPETNPAFNKPECLWQGNRQ